MSVKSSLCSNVPRCKPFKRALFDRRMRWPKSIKYLKLISFVNQKLTSIALLLRFTKSQYSFFSLPDKRKAETKKVCGPFGKIPRDIPDSVHSVGRPVAVQAAEEDLFITSPQHTGLTYLQRFCLYVKSVSRLDPFCVLPLAWTSLSF